MLIDPEPLFCEEGCLLAVQFQRTSAAAIEQALHIDPFTAKSAVVDALSQLLLHVQSCSNCQEK